MFQQFNSSVRSTCAWPGKLKGYKGSATGCLWHMVTPKNSPDPVCQTCYHCHCKRNFTSSCTPVSFLIQMRRLYFSGHVSKITIGLPMYHSGGTPMYHLAEKHDVHIQPANIGIHSSMEAGQQSDALTMYQPGNTLLWIWAHYWRIRQSNKTRPEQLSAALCIIVQSPHCLAFQQIFTVKLHQNNHLDFCWNLHACLSGLVAK